jgi:hypothetical protein
MATFTCVYLGFVSDTAGRKPEEAVTTPDGTTLSALLDILDAMHPGFKAIFISPATGRPVTSRQMLITPKGKHTGPPSKGLETPLEEGMRVIFW